MLIIGCDFHPGFQQVAIFDNQTGEIEQERLKHREQAEQFYRSVAGPALVGMEACGHYPWFERLLRECGHELWLGDASRIRASVVRKQKTDRRDAEHLLDLLREGRFPRIWVPSLEQRDVRQLLVHRHKQVQARTRGAGEAGVAALRGGAAAAVAGAVGWVGSGDQSAEPAGGSRSKAAGAGAATDDASGRGSGDGVGHGADAGTGGAVRHGQASTTALHSCAYVQSSRNIMTRGRRPVFVPALS